jgi:hypothetical protein
MNQAIEIGKQIATTISTVMDADFFVYAFNTIAYPITSKGTDLASWEKAFQGINANGGTACGVALEWMIKSKQKVEQIILITDEGENNTPAFVPTLQKYAKTLSVEIPNVCIVKVQNSCNKLELDMQREKLNLDTYQFLGDYFSLPGLIPFLIKPSKLELLMEIMQFSLPKRKHWSVRK